MRTRAGIVLIQENKIALIERFRNGKTFFVIPGGGVEAHENTRQAAIREGKEELGLNTEIERLLAIIEISRGSDHWLQLYYLVQSIGGEFGKGNGEEFTRDKERGTYTPIWMPLSELGQHKVHPRPLAPILAQGLPKDILHITESSVAKRKL